MDAYLRAPEPKIDVVLHALTPADIDDLMFVLDPDRNAPARAELYRVLQEARRVMPLVNRD